MTLEKVPTFQQVKDWATSTLVTSVNNNTGDITTPPSGGIIMWSGSVSNIPNGWTLCDGTDGTPDLQDRFVVGAGSQYTVGETGGEEEHQLTVDEMPSHNHNANSTSSTNNFDVSGGDVLGVGGSDDVGGDQPHENRPPYYSLAYIMKL
jgi:microcystin-dependent protein